MLALARELRTDNSDKERVQRRVERNGLGGAGEFSGCGVAAEDGDGGRVLIAAEKPLGGGVEGEVARGLASAGDALDEVELAVFGSDGEDDERVFAAIAGVEEEAVRRDGEFGGGVFVGGKVGRDGLDRGVGVDQEALGGVAEARGRPEVVVDGGVDLVDAVDPAAVGVEDDVARAGAGVVVGEGMRVGELTGLGVDEEDGDVVGAEIADEKEAVVGRDGGAVGVGGVLAGGVGAECAELLVVFEVDAVDGLAEGAVGLDAVGGDGAAEVVGDEGGVAGGVDGDVGGACSAGGDLARLFEARRSLGRWRRWWQWRLGR